MAIEYFCAYHSYLNKIAKLSDQEVGRLFRALLKYSSTGEMQELAGRESVAFDFMADDIDRTKEAYEARCQKNREAAAARYEKSANECERMQAIADACDCTQADAINANTNTNTNANNNIYSLSARARMKDDDFVPPTPEEVRDFCEKSGIDIDASQFCAYYGKTGWITSNGPIVDWRDAVVNWVGRERKKGRPKKSQSPSPEFLELAARKKQVEVSV